MGADAVVIDLDRAPARAADDAEDEQQPKLCPDPGPDRLGGRKLFDDLYAQYVRDIVNPQRRPQLPSDLTFALPDMTKPGLVYFDDCRESGGTMIEAKGNYADLLAKQFGRQILTEDWLGQAGKQITASQGRHLEWYFHDASAAAFAAGLFAEWG